MKVIYYDLETTGLDHRTRHAGVQICSLGAYFKEKNEKFMKYLIPTCNVHPMASRINGFQILDDELYKHGELLKDAVPLKRGLEEFLEFLEDIRGEDKDEEIILVSNILQIPYSRNFQQ